jgi:Putative metallopeptidase
MRNPLRSSLTIAAALAALAAGAPTTPAAQAADESQKGTIQIEYETPKDASLQKTYDMARKANALEMLRMTFMSFRLPEDVYIKAVNCDGIANAYYSRVDDRPTIRICYEYLREVYEMLPKEPTPEGITPREALMGQFLFAAAHEFGHAVFDIYDTPVLGRPEDAADQFATYFILQFGGERAHQLIRGAAYAYYDYVKSHKDKPKVTLPIAAFSSDHGTPEQRFYNLICIAYGYDQQIFAVVVEKGYLPEARAKDCRFEYSTLRHALKTLIGPHIDQELAEKVVAIRWFTPPDARETDDWAP